MDLPPELLARGAQEHWCGGAREKKEKEGEGQT